MEDLNAAPVTQNRKAWTCSAISQPQCSKNLQNPPPPPPPNPPPDDPPPPKPDPPELRGADVMTLLARVDIELRSLANIIG